MSTPLEHDYIGLAEVPSMARASGSDQNVPLNLEETELRLGLPGSLSLERSKPNLGVSIFGKDLEFSLASPSRNPAAGAKRGFSDVIDGSSGKWLIFSEPEADLPKGSSLFSPRGVNGVKALDGNGEGKVGKKEGLIVPQTTKPVQAEKSPQVEHGGAPASKAQVVGWPPIRSFRKNTMASNLAKNNDDSEAKSGSECLYVKVSLDGAPYLRKVDLKTYTNYVELSTALEKMFSCFTIGQSSSNGLSGRDGLTENCLKDILHGSEFVLTYEDKDGDWMLVGDVPWVMFSNSCRRLRIMKSSEAVGLAPRAMDKCKNRD